MRDLELVVPKDCVAACNEHEHAFALEQMECMLKAGIAPSEELDLAVLCDCAPDA